MLHSRSGEDSSVSLYDYKQIPVNFNYASLGPDGRITIVMSQVLNYGFPQGERMYCDNPVCNELATNLAKTPSAEGEREIFGCPVHFDQLLTGQSVLRRIKLNKPGYRNPSEPKEVKKS